MLQTGPACTAWDICSTSQRLGVKVKIHFTDQEMGGWVGGWVVVLLLMLWITEIVYLEGCIDVWKVVELSYIENEMTYNKLL
jgi:hypothetical protein